MIRWERHAEAVSGMLRKVLQIQETGSKEAARAFIERYSRWDERHERLGAAMRAAEQYRYARPIYGLLDGGADEGLDDAGDDGGASSSR